MAASATNTPAGSDMRSVLLLLTAGLLAAAEPLNLVASVPDLGDLATRVGGDAVRVTTLARGDEDPHSVEPRPAFVTALAKADALLEIGLDYDTHWLDEAGATRAGLVRLKTHEAVDIIKAPSKDGHDHHGHGHAGHQHAEGNPHFLCDPVAGAQVCLALGAALGRLRPADQAAFTSRAEATALDLAEALVGPAAVARVGREGTLAALANNDLRPFQGPDLAGWMGRLKPLAGVPLIADHDGWPYLARRFDLALVAFLEPEPGVPTSTSHLAGIVAKSKTLGVRGLLVSPWADNRQVQTVAKAIERPVAILAPQTGALAAASGYRATIETNVAALEAVTR